MMNNSEYQNSTCEYAEQIAAYVYDEFDDTQKTGFESHLQNCRSCADELTDLSSVHFSIQEWKTIDFDPLPTPIFTLPNESKTVAEKSSWYEDIKAFFKFSPAFLTAAAAVLVLSLGMIWIIANSSKTQNVAQNDNKHVQTPDLQKKVEQDSKIQEVASESDSEKLDEKLPNILPNQTKDKSLKNVSLPVKTTERKRVLTTLDKPSALTVASVNNHQARNKNDIPSLNLDKDEEEDSLRLSDLFEEVGMTKPDEVNNE